MEPGYMVLIYSSGAGDPWVGAVRCRTKTAAEKIMRHLGEHDADDGLSIWIIEDFGES